MNEFLPAIGPDARVLLYRDALSMYAKGARTVFARIDGKPYCGGIVEWDGTFYLDSNGYPFAPEMHYEDTSRRIELTDGMDIDVLSGLDLNGFNVIIPAKVKLSRC
jgi:hypothetical protein